MLYRIRQKEAEEKIYLKAQKEKKNRRMYGLTKTSPLGKSSKERIEGEEEESEEYYITSAQYLKQFC